VIKIAAPPDASSNSFFRAQNNGKKCTDKVTLAQQLNFRMAAVAVAAAAPIHSVRKLPLEVGTVRLTMALNLQFFADHGSHH